MGPAGVRSALLDSGEMSAPYRLGLRHSDDPPVGVIARLREELPDVTITIDRARLTFAADDPALRSRVHAALERVYGAPGWGEYFYLLPGDPGAA